MFARLCAHAPVVLLLASLSGHAASGSVLVHMAMDHAPMASHRDHHGDAGVDHLYLDHDAEHSHELVLATVVAARIAGQCLSLHLMPAVRQDLSELPDGAAMLHRTPPAQRTYPLIPKRHSILLI